MDPFATADDVAARLGRDLTEHETTLADSVIETVGGLILEAVERDEDWAEAQASLPVLFETLCVEKAVALVAEPVPTVAAETLGAYSVTWARSSDAGVFLTKSEKRDLRREVWGSGTRAVNLATPYSGDPTTDETVNDLVL